MKVKYQQARIGDKFLIRWADGVHFGANSMNELIRLMKLDSWDMLPSISEYKSTTQFRASINGHNFAYWDSESFLTGLEQTGLIRILVWKGIDISSGVC